MAGLLALSAIELSKFVWLEAHGIGALTLAIGLGMIIGNTTYVKIAAVCAPGVTFSKQILLRAGIVLFGLRLTFQDIANVGLPGVVIDALILSSTFGLSWWAGTRLLGIDRRTAMLIGAGSSNCGAAAIMATEPVVRGRADQVTVTISTVVVFGTLAIILYPALYEVNARYHVLTVSPTQYGLFAGSIIHEVAQVVADGRAVSEVAANTAVIAKMVRVMMLAPFLVLLAAYLSRPPTGEIGQSLETVGTMRRIVIPQFAVGFIAVAALNSFGFVPHALVGIGLSLDAVLLAMAMAALGLTTHISAMRAAGLKPLALSALLFGWLLVGGGGINAVITVLFD